MKRDHEHVMTQVLALPLVLGVLAMITGVAGIYIAKRSANQLYSLSAKGMGPVLAFQDISVSLDALTNDFLELKQDGGMNKQQEILHLNLTKRAFKKTSRLVSAQKQAVKGQKYEPAFIAWYDQWRRFHDWVEPNLESMQAIGPYLTPASQELEILSKGLNEIYSSVQNDMIEMVENYSKFSRNAVFALILTLIAGTFLGIIISVLAVRKINRVLSLITEGTRNIESILNNLDQGFLTFNREGIIQKEISSSVRELYGTDPVSKAFQDILPVSNDKKAVLTDWYRAIFGDTDIAGTLNFDDLKGIAPRSFERNGRYIELDYRPVYVENSSEKYLEKVICIASDKTHERQLRETAANEAAFVKMVLRLLRDRSAFADFTDEVRTNITIIKNLLDRPLTSSSLNTIFRAVHSIKGGAGSFHLLEIQNLAHLFENELSRLEELDETRLAMNTHTLREHTEVICSTFETFLIKHHDVLGNLNENTDDKKLIPVSELYKMAHLLEKLGNQSPMLVQTFYDSFILEPADSLFDRYKIVVSDLARQNAKKATLEIVRSPIRVYLDAYKSLISTYVHVFRNAIDHGIESSAERILSEKSEKGKITVMFYAGDIKGQDAIRIVVTDDGRGVDPNLIREAALNKNIVTQDVLNAMSDQEAIQLVFAPGFSSKSEITTLSGRGVGLDALKVEALRLGGRAWIESQVGKYTRVIVEVPLIRNPPNIAVDLKTSKKAA